MQLSRRACTPRSRLALVIKEIPAMDFNLRVLISHLLIASKSWLKVIQDSLSSELSSGQPFA